MNDIILSNNRFLGHTNPIMTAAVTDGGSVLDREYIQLCARQMVDMGLWGNLKLWVDPGLCKQSSTLVSKSYDISGNGNDATQSVGTNQPTYNTISIAFDGVDNYIQVAYDADINLQTLSLCLYVKRIDDNVSSLTSIVAREVATSPTEVPYRFYYSLESSAPALRFEFYTGGASRRIYETGGLLSTKNQWYHYVCTAEVSGSDTLLKMYRDASLVASGTITGYLPPQRNVPLFIGAENNRRFSGSEIGDLRLFNTVLTGTQITAIYNQTSYRYA